MSELITSLWVEKYRPQTLESYLTNDEYRKKFESYIEKKDIGNLLLYGVQGTGKTTLAKILASAIADDDVLYVNASSENGIDTVRDRIVGFAKTRSFSGGLKIVIFDEFDFATANAQAALRAVVEQYSFNTRFIFTCNYIDKVIKPIQSRCQLFDIEPPSMGKVAKLCTEILTSEGVSFDIKDVAKVIKELYPDIRQIINYLQKNSYDGTLRLSAESEHLTNVDKIVSILKSKQSSIKKYVEIRQEVANMAIRDHSPLYKMLFDRVDEYAEGHVTQCILLIGEMQFKDSFVVDHEISLISLFIQLIKELENEG